MYIMDSISSGSIGGASVLGIIAIIGFVYKAVNHHRCRSNCFGKKLEVSMDIEETTPPIKILIPKVDESITVPPVSDADKSNP